LESAQGIKNANARQRIEQAFDYKRKIEAIVAKQTGLIRGSLESAIMDLDSWIEVLFALAQSIDSVESNPAIRQERRFLPAELNTLRHQLEMETNPSDRAFLEEAIITRQQRLDSLQSIVDKAEEAEGKMDQILIQMIGVYTLVLKFEDLDNRQQ
jgi:hypothetical protein